MAGNWRSGRRPAPGDIRTRLDGTDRPEMPDDLDAIGRAYWESAITGVAHLRRCDSILAGECCRLFSLYRRATKACERKPLDGEAASVAGRYFRAWTASVEFLALDFGGRSKADKLFRRDDAADAATEIKFFGDNQ